MHFLCDLSSYDYWIKMFRSVFSSLIPVHLTHWKELKKSWNYNNLTKQTLWLALKFYSTQELYLFKVFSLNLNCFQCEQSLRHLISGELFTVLYLQAEGGDISNTLFTQTQQATIALPKCDSKPSLRMTHVSIENNINRPNQAQS